MGILSAFRFAFQNLFFTPVLYGVIASLAVFSATWEKGDRVKDRITDPFRSQQDTFDFVVVGGGTSGAIVATRLSEFYSVLLLEAGGEAHPFQEIPALSLFIPNYPATDWSHKTITQTTSCLICKDKRYTFSQGKNLGGSSNLNYLIYLRGSPKDFDNWARITGDKRWSYEGVLPHFQIAENFVGTTTDEAAHGVNGPMQIEMPTEIGLANEWNWAGQEMGYRHLDLNGRYDEGFDALYYPIKQGIRQATYRSYILPARDRPSLLIRKFAHVNKVLIKEGSNVAYGVQYDRHGISCNAFANKEIIISAGSLQTPKILMLSGIGPRANLEHLHIPVRSDLPVGQNLHDHVSTLLGPFFINSPKTFSYDDDVTAKSFIEFHTQGTGALTTSGFQATALITSSYAKALNQANWPDIQLTLFGMTPHRLFASDLAHTFGLKESILQRYYLHARRKNGFFIMVTVARPESRGDLCLKSTDPKHPLVINPNFFSDQTNKDMRVMIEGIRRALYIAENTTVFQNCQTHYSTKCFPGCENYVFRSDAYWECYVRHFTLTMNDQTGTCAMGAANSPFSVVDPELKVMGVTGLRVVDASVMPTVVGANAQASTIMIGEKGSSFIIERWNNVDDFKTGGDDTTQYGPPNVEGISSPPENTLDTGVTAPVDDFGSLLVPPGAPPEAYENFANFNQELRSKGLTLPSDLNSQVSPSSTSNFLSDPGSSISPEEDPSTQLLPPVSNFPDISDSPSPTPPLYNEVYDPNFQTSGSSQPPPTLATLFSPSSTQRVRESKSFDTGSVNNIIEDPAVVATSSSKPSTASGDDESTSVLTRGPNGSVIIRRRKRPPNVSVHPRGHLGFEDVTRRPRNRFTGTTPITISTSIIPLPKEVVTIRRRRPGGMRTKRLRTTTPMTPDLPEERTTLQMDDSPSQSNELTDVTTQGNLDRLEATTTKRVSRGFVLSNSSRVSQSVSAVINRLRNFIPSNRNKRGQTDTTSFNYKSKSRNSLGIKIPTSSIPKTTTVKETASGEEVVDDDSYEEREEMIIFSDVEVKGQEESLNNNNKEEDEDGMKGHPFMPMDMNPVPKIIANSPKKILISPKERNQFISKYKRAKTKRVFLLSNL